MAAMTEPEIAQQRPYGARIPQHGNPAKEMIGVSRIYQA